MTQSRNHSFIGYMMSNLPPANIYSFFGKKAIWWKSICKTGADPWIFFKGGGSILLKNFDKHKKGGGGEVGWRLGIGLYPAPIYLNSILAMKSRRNKSACFVRYFCTLKTGFTLQRLLFAARKLLFALFKLFLQPKNCSIYSEKIFFAYSNWFWSLNKLRATF